MNVKLLSVAIAFAFSGAVFAADAPPPPADMPKTPEAWAALMWDFTKNPMVLKEPKAFVPWMNAALEPSFYTGLGMQSMDPSMWAFMVNSMMNPAAYSAWMPLMTDPNVYMKWLAASLDPNFYNAILAQFTDPGKMMRWLMAPVDPKLWTMMLQTLNPAMYLKWMMSPLDPQWLRAGINTMNPAMYMGWLGSALNPASYGDLWKGFLTYPLPGVPTVPSTMAPPAATPYGTFNFFDPNAWAQMWQVPGGATAAPPAAGTTQPYLFNPFDPNSWSQFLQVPGQQPATAAPPAAK